MMSAPPTPPLPPDLIRDIRSGQALAFIGAGFVSPLVPGWSGLLRGLAERVADPARRAELVDRLSRPVGALELEALAQILRNDLRDGFEEALQGAMIGSPEARDRIDARLEHLHAMPLKGVITTNFDDLLTGVGADSAAFVKLIRETGSPWRPLDRTAVLKIHGELGQAGNPVVLTRDDYRTRIHERSDYAAFLKSMLATHPIVFMGTSFTDAYLNEARSEVLSWFGGSRARFAGKPNWWAIMPDATEDTRAFFAAHEGTEVVSYPSADEHSAFDDVLSRLRRATSPEESLAERLRDVGARILWYDPQPENNLYGRDLLCAQADVRCERTIPSTLDALGAAAAEGRPFDLLISRYGYRSDADPEVVELLAAMRSARSQVPTLVFAAANDVDARRRQVRAAGAIDYTWSWPDMLRCVAELFETDVQRRVRLGLA